MNAVRAIAGIATFVAWGVAPGAGHAGARPIASTGGFLEPDVAVLRTDHGAPGEQLGAISRVLGDRDHGDRRTAGRVMVVDGAAGERGASAAKVYVISGASSTR